MLRYRREIDTGAVEQLLRDHELDREVLGQGLEPARRVHGVAERRQTLGWLAPIFLARGFATLFVLGHSVRQRLRWPRWSPRLAGTVALIGVVDTAGYVCFNVGAEHAATAIVAAASVARCAASSPLSEASTKSAASPQRSSWSSNRSLATRALSVCRTRPLHGTA